MRIETYTKTIATFKELNKEQQEKVYDKLRYINTDHEWWDHTKEDFHAILEILGFYNIESNFSGFCSQGDGASFKAAFTLPTKGDKVKDRLLKLKEYAPVYFKDAKSLLSELLDLDYQLSGYHTGLIIRKSTSRYCHNMTMQGENDNLLNVARQLATKYYRSLESEYDYLSSNEAIKETIECNEYEFNLDTLNIA